MTDYEHLQEETIYQGPIFDLVQIKLQLPDGKSHTYDMVRHAGAVTIMPLDEQGRIWFVRQYRVGADKSLLELPAGLFNSGESVEAAARREVQEEIGMAAGKLELLGSFYLTPGYSTEKLYAYLATELFESSLPMDEDEFIERVAIKVEDVFKMVARGEIEDGKTLAALLMALPHLKSPQI